MDEKVYEELDNAKAEIEKLRSEYSVKADLCDNLKRSNSDQVKRIQELNLKLEKQAQEVEEKAEEVYGAKQSLEDLECKLKEKENIIKSFTSANEKLRVDFNSKLRECEEERVRVVSLLEEANAKILDLEHENRAFIDKIEVLKEGIYSVSQKKCANESKMENVSKQMRENGDLFDKLEDEKVKLEEQLKWKHEQFKHLEEAHERLRDNLRAKEKEWDVEKCTFIDEISALKTKLESQFRLSEVLKRRLETCTQSLGLEEDRRKCLDIQLAESSIDLEEIKSQLERLTEEKECISKEMECKIGKLEEENQGLVLSLKELDEYKIREASNSSTIKNLQNELKTLEQIYDDCSNQSKVKEAEWISRFETVDGELNSCRLKLESKEHRMKEMTTELDDYNSLVLQLTVEKEAMKSTLMEARLKLESLNAEEEKLQNKFETLEQIHRAGEAEWSSLFEKRDAELNSCRLELESKEAVWSSQFEKVDAELNSCRHESESKEAEWSSRYEKVEEELNSCRLELERKEAEWSSQFEKVDAELNSCILESECKVADWNTRYEKVEAELNSCRLELESKEAEWSSQFEKVDAELNHCILESESKGAEWNTRYEKVEAELNACKLELESKEAEWSSQFDKVDAELNSRRLESESKGSEWSSRFEKVEAELDSCRLELESKEAEWSSQFEKVDAELNSCRLESESQGAEWSARFEKVDAELNFCRLELESKEMCLKEITTQLDDHNSLLLQFTIENEAMKSTLLEARSELECLKTVTEGQPSLPKEITSYEEELVQTKSELADVCDLLDKASEELVDSYCEVNEVEFELQVWKSVAEKLKADLVANHGMRREVEASLLAQVAIEVNLKEDVEEKERRINDLEENIKELKQNTRLRLAKDNGEELEKWEQEWVTKELEAAILLQLESEKIHEHEKKSLNQLVEEKDKRIDNLQEIMSSLEEDFAHSSTSFSSQLAKMQVEMNLFHETWEKIRTTVVLKEIEVQEKNLIITELEKEFEKQVKKLVSENEKLMDFIECVSERITKLSREDGQVMGTLRSIMLSFDENRHVELKDRFDPLKENTNLYDYPSPKRNTVVNNVDERSPLRALNS